MHEIQVRSSLPNAALRAGLLSLAVLTLQAFSLPFDAAWHNTPELQVPFLGLRHPWTLAHFGLVIAVPIATLLLAGLVTADAGRRRVEGGMAMLSLLGRRGPAGAMFALAAIVYGVVALIFDTISHWYINTGDDPVFTAPHLMLISAGIFEFVGLVALLYDLAFGPALAAEVDQRWLARAGLLLGLVWLTAACAMVFPTKPGLWSASFNAGEVALTVGSAVVVAIRLWPWPFPVLTVLVPYVIFRAAAYGLLVSNGYVGAPRPLEPLLLSGLAVDLWLLLPANRARGVITVALAGLIFSVVWAPFGYSYLLPLSAPGRGSLVDALEKAAAAGAGGALVGTFLATIVTRLCQWEAAVTPSVGVPETTELIKL